MILRLAALLGKSVPELLATTNGAELAEWEAFYKLEPWGGEFLKLLAGTVAATVENWSPKKTKEWAKPADYFPDPYAPLAKPPSRKVLKAKLAMFCGPTNAKHQKSSPAHDSRQSRG